MPESAAYAQNLIDDVSQPYDVGVSNRSEAQIAATILPRLSTHSASISR